MGTGMDERARPLRFENPPVRRTNLALRYEATGHVQASHVAPLRSLWRDAYPNVDEQVPTPPSEGPQAIRLSGRGTTWPLARTTYSTSDGQRSIEFQGDEFGIAWEFSEDSSYPGFEELVRELEERLADFEKTLRDEAGISLVITGAECRYENVIDGVDVAGLATGVLTGWTGTPGGHLPGAGYVGVRIHACADEDSHKCSSYLAVDGDVGDESIFSISVSRNVDSSEESTLGGMRDAHDELIELFVQYTSEEQREAWGRVELS
ncbi:hypothetical protein [Luteipulveratus halotolerans]|uniref:hypothetical protein n=1 Tax=Luteipulveratus halotolerans TaxID=1631356 RepID=UPI0012F86654|nr:hypothetical protein [Luteipulveratus halotolerans]